MKNSLKVCLIQSIKKIKTESTRILSNFNFQWTKSLYQNNLNCIADVNYKSSVITPKKISYESLGN